MTYRITYAHKDGSQEEGPAVFTSKANAIRCARFSTKGAAAASLKEQGFVTVWVDNVNTDSGVWHCNL
jgi:hypothetical protein